MITQIISLFFYLLMVALIVYSLIAIYSLLRYGRSQILGIGITLLYLIITASLYAAAVTNLNKL